MSSRTAKFPSTCISLEALAAAEFNDVFLDRQLRQDVRVLYDVLAKMGDGVSCRNVGKPLHLDAAAA